MEHPYSAGLARYFQAFANRERAQAYVELLRRDLPPQAALLDIGAGLGQVALGLAEAGHAVWALEPDADMRTVMLTLASQRPGLPLTVLPWRVDAQTPDLPTPVAAASAFSLLHLLPAEAQTGLLTWVARQLQPGGWLWLELPMQSPERVAGDWQLYGERTQGAGRLSMRTRLQGSDAQGWRTSWRFELRLGPHGSVVEEAEQRWHWQALTPDALQALLAKGPGWQVLDDWADEHGTPYRAGTSPRRLLRLMPR